MWILGAKPIFGSSVKAVLVGFAVCELGIPDIFTFSKSQFVGREFFYSKPLIVGRLIQCVGAVGIGTDFNTIVAILEIVYECLTIYFRICFCGNKTDGNFMCFSPLLVNGLFDLPFAVKGLSLIINHRNFDCIPFLPIILESKVRIFRDSRTPLSF